MEKYLVDLIGYIAGVLVAITMVPQIILSLKTKNVTGLSLGMLVIFFLSMVLWVVYGYKIGSYPLMLTNGLATLVSGVQLYLKLRYSR
ncbi:MAG TPA: SemiSWEET family transporter [Patescibacteria group bacterium]|nr:SemiSWEET family transporter [Patescibacteria group bacterium]